MPIVPAPGLAEDARGQAHLCKELFLTNRFEVPFDSDDAPVLIGIAAYCPTWKTDMSVIEQVISTSRNVARSEEFVGLKPFQPDPCKEPVSIVRSVYFDACRLESEANGHGP